MAGADDQGRLALVAGFEVGRREVEVPLAGLDLLDGLLLVELADALGDAALADQFDGLAIAVRTLAGDLLDLRGPDPGILGDEPEPVPTLDGEVLVVIADQQDAGPLVLC